MISVPSIEVLGVSQYSPVLDSIGYWWYFYWLSYSVLILLGQVTTWSRAWNQTETGQMKEVVMKDKLCYQLVCHT